MAESSPVLLGVNIDHVATLRQARGTRYPEPLHAALLAEQAGADGITLHLREDRRHIQERDLAMLSETLQTRMNLEMAATTEMLALARNYAPQDCCLVPEKREELTTEGGLDAASNQAMLRDYCAALAEAGIRVSLFIDADCRQLDAALACGAPVVEIHTGHYADARDAVQRAQQFDKIVEAVNHGVSLGLQVNAGHGLDYHNVQSVSTINGLRELNIGHSIMARALFSGLAEAVREMKRLIREAATRST
jgi:pyridoxine 5-phosphate synthase